MVQLTQGGRMGPTVIYIHTEGMGKILMNIFEIYCTVFTVDDTVKKNVLGFRDNNFFL
jgi:hypothetical protein